MAMNSYGIEAKIEVTGGSTEYDLLIGRMASNMPTDTDELLTMGFPLGQQFNVVNCERTGGGAFVFTLTPYA
jgi:hypothetical protein